MFFSILSLLEDGFLSINNQCRPGGKFGDLFAWVQYSNYLGERMIEKKLCQIWNLVYKNVNLTVFANGTLPVVFQETVQEPNDTIIINFMFENFTAGNIPANIFDVPASCSGHGIVCKGTGLEVMDTYRFHPVNQYKLDNTNSGDPLGDTAFVCLRGMGGPDQLISHFTVKVNTSWGQYGLCNFNSCLSISNETVGREATAGLTQDGGQCTANENLGNWYSFQGNAKCTSEDDFTDCGWFQLDTVKTINGTCLLENGFYKACEADKTFPFKTATQVFLNSFTYDQPSQGGCPNINPDSAASSFSRDHRHQLPPRHVTLDLLPFRLPVLPVL